MVYRLMVGLGSVGVERVVIMPAGSGLLESVLRALRSHPELERPALEVLDLGLSGTADDTIAAVEAMLAARVDAIAVLGGDGTSRLVARRSADVPLCPLSTGTNNAFPEIREATVAGIATGLVATGRVGREEGVRKAKCLRVRVPGSAETRCDLALVDVALTTEPWVGARALWCPADISEAVIAFGEPGGVGLSAIAGLVDPVGKGDPWGLHVRLAPPQAAELVVRAPLAPGLVVPVGIAATTRIRPGETIALEAPVGSVALDGERELELAAPTTVEVELALDGPAVVDIESVMAVAARRGLLEADRLAGP